MTKPKYFICDPARLCDGASCCKDITCLPELGVSDYLRLSEAINMPIGEFWKEHGDIALASLPELPSLMFKIGLGLFHEPCSFLTPKNSCEVYDNRPLACASFPGFLLTEHPDLVDDVYRDYKCLQGICLSPEQLKDNDKMDKLFTKAAELDLKYFWTNGLKYVDLSDPYQHHSLGINALKFQRQRDKTGKSPKTKRLERVIDEFQEVLERNGTKQLRIHANVYRSYWVPIALSFCEDAIKQHLEGLSKQALDEYRDFNDEVRRVYREMKGK